MAFEVRPYRAKDLAALYRICLQTADGGGDASHLFSDEKLIGHYYVAPYAQFDADVCFMVFKDNQACGYIVGCKSSRLFQDKCEKQWFPTLRKQYCLESYDNEPFAKRVISLIHTGYQIRPEYDDYPAHLHINLMPGTQGAGLGRQLMTAFINKLSELKVTGLHLEVSRTNKGAILFYEKVGFKVIAEFEHSIGYGMKL